MNLVISLEKILIESLLDELSKVEIGVDINSGLLEVAGSESGTADLSFESQAHKANKTKTQIQRIFLYIVLPPNITISFD